MAITQIQEPQGYAPTYNPVEWVVSSDKTGEENFKYVADVQISGVTTPTFFRLKQQADPKEGLAVFDVHRILANFIASDIDKSTFGFQRNQQSFVRYDIKFGEEFNTVPGATTGATVFADQLVKTDNFVINGALEFLDFINFKTTDFLIGATGNPFRFLTDAPKTLRKIRNGADAWLHLIWDTTNEVDRYLVATLDENDAVIQVVQVDNNFTDVSDHVQRFLRISAGFNMNSIPAGDISLGSQPILTSSVASYSIVVANNVNVGRSDIVTFAIDYECTKHNEFTVHFLNRLGGFDTFTFIRLSRETTDIKRKKYKKKAGTLTATAFTYSPKDRGDVVLDTEAKDRVRVTSDWLTAAESTWLKQLITSPEVYQDDGTDLIAIDIVNSRYESKKVENDVIFNYTLEFEFSHLNVSQRG